MLSLGSLSAGMRDFLAQIGQPASRDGYFAINLSSRYRWYLAPARLGIIVLVGIILGGIGWDIWRSVLVWQELQSIQDALEQVQERDRAVLKEAQQQGIDLSEAALQVLPKEIEFANQLIEKRAFSWTNFLTELEQAIPPRIAVNSIRLEPTNGTILLNGAARALEDVTTLTVAFQDHPRFKDPVLGQHRDAGNGIVEFDLSIRYRSRNP
ncbi:MAG TPA: PilN domain-containing protein [Nitrospiraceae bacterium]|nr:PilN domain-containing protein [Nitrospiraceae bacterium]